jgi:two-component system chemotaxis sensor kinase CheA
VSKEEIQSDFKPVLVKDQRQIPYINLIKEFKEDKEAHQRLNLVVLHYNEKEMGIIINDVMGNYQAVIKPLGKMIQQKEFFSGASILGDGDVALVMDTNRIINQFINE